MSEIKKKLGSLISLQRYSVWKTTLTLTDVNKTRNMEHCGTSQNIPEHRIIIIMSKICKTKFSKIKLTKNKPVSAQNMKKKTKTKKKKKNENDCNE